MKLLPTAAPARMGIAALLTAMTLTTAPSPAEANQAAVSMLNSIRAQMGKPPVRYNKRLERAARAHAKDMAQSGVRGHVSSNGAQLSDRVKRSGYKFCFAAENVGWGQKSMQGVMKAWLNSSGHRKNMLTGKAQEVGIAEAQDGVWVMVLGRDGC